MTTSVGDSSVIFSTEKGFRLTDPTFQLAPVELTRREVFSFSVARKLLQGFVGTPLELDMRSVMDKQRQGQQGKCELP